MFEYKSEVYIPSNTAGVFKTFNDKDTAVLDELINKHAAEGWELVTNAVAANNLFILTFKRGKQPEHNQ